MPQLDLLQTRYQIRKLPYMPSRITKQTEDRFGEVIANQTNLVFRGLWASRNCCSGCHTYFKGTRLAVPLSGSGNITCICSRPMLATKRRLPGLVAPGIILAGGLALLPQTTLAKPEYTQITKQECAYCHASLRDRKLTEAGLYFRTHRTLKGYPPKNPSSSAARNRPASA